MKLRITPTVLDEVRAAIEDALGRTTRNNTSKFCDPTDKTYLKINEAPLDRHGGCVIEADTDDVCELKDRAEYVIQYVVPDNLPCRDKVDRIYWLNLSRAYRGLLKQIAAGESTPRK